MAGSKQRIPDSVRRDVATNYGCFIGQTVAANCHHCGATGKIHWAGRATGKGYVAFSALEMDHLVPEFRGGQTTALNIVLACRRCNRSKGTNAAPKWGPKRGAH